MFLATAKNGNMVSEGEFSNIKNNPVWQIKQFASERTRLHQDYCVEEYLWR